MLYMRAFGNETKTGRVSVQAVHGMIGEGQFICFVIIYDRVSQRSRAFASRLVHEQTCRFVDCQKIIVLIRDM